MSLYACTFNAHFRVYIHVLIKRNNFLKSTSSEIIFQIHNEDRILHCIAGCEFSFVYYGFQLSPGVYWCKNKYNLLLDLIKKQGHNVLVEKQRQPYLLKDLDKVLETQSFVVIVFFSIQEWESPIPWGKITFFFFLIKKNT